MSCCLVVGSERVLLHKYRRIGRLFVFNVHSSIRFFRQARMYFYGSIVVLGISVNWVRNR